MHTIQQAINQGLELHRQGNLAGAERLYREVLAADPRQPDAWHLLGLVAHAAGNQQVAIECIGRAIQLDGGQPSFHLHLAEVYRALGEWNQAEAAGRQALRLNADFAVGHNTLGAILGQQQRWEEAASAYRRAVEIDPRLGIAHANLAAALRSLGRLSEAEASARQAIACDAADASAQYELGQVLEQQGRTADAMQAYHEAVRCNPRLADAHFQLGLLLQRRGSHAAAIECYRQAVAAVPGHVAAYNNLGTLYRSQGEYERATECYAKILELVPDSPEALNNLGNVLKRQGRLDEAAVCYDRTLRVQHDNPQAHYNRGLVLLAKGNLAAGWPEYEWRERCPEFERRGFKEPRWQGEKLDGRTLLVYAEQGLGDTLQMLRYVPLVATRAGRIVLEVQRALVPLVRAATWPGSVEIVARGDKLPAFDAQVPLMSVPGALGTTLENIPAAEGYLQADAALVEHWRERLAGVPGYRVGITWQGSPTYQGDRERSIPLVEFAPLAMPGVSLVSLQKGPGVEQLANPADRFAVHTLGDDVDQSHGAFQDTAAVMQHLDLVVTSDTAVAHLAGALGAAVWVAIPFAPDWRWLLEREDSPWYASMRLVRQERPGEWGAVFARMAAELRSRAK